MSIDLQSEAVVEIDELVFYHFNDVYHVNQPVLSRFAYDFKNKKNAITVFSGDALGPSLESSMLEGEHIIPILNYLEIDIACYGNHDFDFGEHRLDELSAQCNFPFVLSNAFNSSGKLLAAAKAYEVREHAGYRIGFFGLAGSDWPSNCYLPPGTRIANPIEVATEISETLAVHEHVDMVVAVTHMRLEEDLILSESCPHVDLILGGHDHDIVVYGERVTTINDDSKGRIRIVKSGTDFRSYSKVSVPVKDRKLDFNLIQVHHERDLSIAQSHPEDPKIHDLTAHLQEHITSISSKPLFYAGSPLEGRGSVVRTSESNLGNLLADIVRAYHNTDIALINSGSIRCDRVIPEGVVTMRDVIDIQPFCNTFVVKRLSTEILCRALENSVSDSRTDGRFLQLSGISITVDFRRPEGSRIIAISHDGTIVQPSSDEFLTVALSGFLALGFDGFECFTEASVETLIGEEGAMTDTGVMLAVLNLEGQVLDEHIALARQRVFVDSEKPLPLARPIVEGRILVL